MSLKRDEKWVRVRARLLPYRAFVSRMMRRAGDSRITPASMTGIRVRSVSVAHPLSDQSIRRPLGFTRYTRAGTGRPPVAAELDLALARPKVFLFRWMCDTRSSLLYAERTSPLTWRCKVTRRPSSPCSDVRRKRFDRMSTDNSSKPHSARPAPGAHASVPRRLSSCLPYSYTRCYVSIHQPIPFPVAIAPTVTR